MKLAVTLACTATLMLCASCGANEKLDEMKQHMDNVQNMADNTNNADKLQEQALERREERRKRGDTLAMPYQDLQKYLPASVNGYTAAEPKGESFNMAGMSYSTAHREFTNEQGERVQVNLIDYNSAYSMLTAATAFWQAGYSMETSDQIQRTFDPGLGSGVGFEDYNKNSKSAKVTYVLGDRFLLTVEADNAPGTDFVKDIAASMPLKELTDK